jgi:hypothetical protein
MTGDCDASSDHTIELDWFFKIIDELTPTQIVLVICVVLLAVCLYNIFTNSKKSSSDSSTTTSNT